MSAAFKGGDKMHEFLTKMSQSLQQKCVVKVGFLEGSMAGFNGPRPKSRGGSKDSKARGGQSPAPVVAMALEYGVPEKNIKPYPFFSGMIAKNSPTWNHLIQVALKSQGYNSYDALKLVGLKVKEQLTESIQDFSAAHNELSTIMKKNMQDTPLKDSLNLLHSVDYVIVPDEDGEK